MRILIVVERSPRQRFLVHLHTDALRDEVKSLIGKSRHSEAMALAFARGRFEREVDESEIAHLDTRLILTEKAAKWCIER